MNESSDEQAKRQIKAQPEQKAETGASQKSSGKPKRSCIIPVILVSIIVLCLSAGLLTSGWMLYQEQESRILELSTQVQSIQSSVQISKAQLENNQSKLIKEAPWAPSIESLAEDIQQNFSAQKEVIEALEAKFKIMQPSDLM